MSSRENRGQGGERPLQKYKSGAAVLLLAAACGLVLYGLSRGEAAIVLNKAVNICLECIGLG